MTGGHERYPASRSIDVTGEHRREVLVALE
jgi:hypothetical protein